MIDMNKTTNYNDFKKAVESVPQYYQRQLGVRFIKHVMDLVKDQRVGIALEVAKRPQANAEVLKSAYHSVQKVIIGTFTHCVHKINMMATAEHYVALAALVCVQPTSKFQPEEYPACKVALLCRHARSFEALASRMGNLSL